MTKASVNLHLRDENMTLITHSAGYPVVRHGAWSVVATYLLGTSFVPSTGSTGQER